MTSFSIEGSTRKTELRRPPSFGLVRSMPVEGDAATVAALSVVHDAYSGRPATVARVLDTDHTDVYNNQLLNGDRPIPLHLFIRLLLALPIETARQSLQAIGNALGLDVVLRSDARVADVKSEAVEASAACGIAFATVHSAIKDGAVTDEEKVQIAGAVREAQRQLDDLTRVTG